MSRQVFSNARVAVHVHTKDEAKFEESKHKRDDGGKFSHTQGGGGGAAAGGSTAPGFVGNFMKQHGDPAKAAAHLKTLPDAKLQAAIKNLHGHADKDSVAVRGMLNAELQRRGATNPTGRDVAQVQKQNAANEAAKKEAAKAKPNSALKAEEGDARTLMVEHTPGQPLPQHIQDLKVPPAWKNLRYSNDPKAALQVVGKDDKGRRVAIYSDEFQKTQAAVKFERLKALDAKFEKVQAANAKAQASEDQKVKDAADALALIIGTGLRPGSDKDTKASVKAYGATTLKGSHVQVDGDKVSLQFTGKKGVNLNIPIDDPKLAKVLKDRKAAAGDGKLFPATDDKALRSHVAGIAGAGFKTKDFRTLLATRTAMETAADMKEPENEKQYRQQVMQVAKVVSRKLGNTPTIALQSYINPAVFAHWRK